MFRLTTSATVRQRCRDSDLDLRLKVGGLQENHQKNQGDIVIHPEIGALTNGVSEECWTRN